MPIGGQTDKKASSLTIDDFSLAAFIHNFISYNVQETSRARCDIKEQGLLSNRYLLTTETDDVKS